MDDLLPYGLFLYGSMVLYVVIGMVVHLTYGRNPKSDRRKDAS